MSCGFYLNVHYVLFYFSGDGVRQLWIDQKVKHEEEWV